MGIVDIIILIFIGFGILLGFKRGFTRELVSLLGIFVILVLSFLFKNPVSVFFYNNLPFFNFGGIFKDITVLNILLYEVLAFLVVFFVLTILFKLLVSFTKAFEKILNATIILGIPSKILGALVGAIKTVIYVFIVLYILSLPTFNLNFIKQSKIGNTILDKTPILASVCDKTINVFNKIIELKDEYVNTDNVKEFNQKALDIMIDNKVITKENAKKLIEKGKIKGVSIN